MDRDENMGDDKDPTEVRNGTEQVLSEADVVLHMERLPAGLRAELVVKLLREEGAPELAHVRNGARERFRVFCEKRSVDPGTLDEAKMRLLVTEMLAVAEDSDDSID